VYRTETIHITASGSDLETAPEALVCDIYYLEPGQSEWKELTANYNTTTFNWYTELPTTKTSSLGNYSFDVRFIDGDGAYSKVLYSNDSVWVRNNLPVISDDLDDINVGKTQYILKLTEYGYDAETSKGSLRWQVDFSSIDTGLFHIEDGNIGNQEITIYPVKNKKGSDDIIITIIDADNGKAVKKDITISVNSKIDGGEKNPDEETPIGKFTESSYLWIYLLIILIVIFIIILFVFYRRKKKIDEGEAETEEVEEESLDGEEESAEEDSKATDEAPAETPEPIAEETEESLPTPTAETTVPMPGPADVPELPSAIEGERERGREEQPSPEPPPPSPDEQETEAETGVEDVHLQK
jgi:hypothetical protein